MDTRTTSADFYPGGKTPVTAGGGITSGETGGAAGEPMVPVTKVEQLPEHYRESDMRSKINELARVISGGVAGIMAMVSLTLGAEPVKVLGVKKDALWNDDFVVTNVAVDLSGYATTGVVLSATKELGAELDLKLDTATNSLLKASAEETAAATNALAQEIDAKISASTNGSMGAATLEPYAKRSWVEAQGYLKSTNLTGYAQVNWVQNQGFIKKENASGEITRIVDEKIAAQDKTAAYRLMAVDGSKWIDGTGVCWEVTSHVRIDGEELSSKGIVQEWQKVDEGTEKRMSYSDENGLRNWAYSKILKWRNDPDDPNSTEEFVEYLYNGSTNLTAGTVVLKLEGEDNPPDQNGTYPPETVTIEHWLTTNIVTRLATTNDMPKIDFSKIPTLTTNDVCAIVTNEVVKDEWELVGTINTDQIETEGDISWEVSFFDERWWVYINWIENGINTGTTLGANETEEDATILTLGHNSYVDGFFRRKNAGVNALGLARMKDLEKLPTHETVTNVARAVVTNEVSGWSAWSWSDGRDRPDPEFSDDDGDPRWRIQSDLEALDYQDLCREPEDATVLTWANDDGSYKLTARRHWLSGNALGLAMAKDLEKLPTHETVTNIVQGIAGKSGSSRVVYYVTTNTTINVDGKEQDPFIDELFGGIAFDLYQTNAAYFIDGDIPTLKLLAPHRRSAYFGNQFTAIEIGDEEQLLRTHILQADGGIAVRSPENIRFMGTLNKEKTSATTLSLADYLEAVAQNVVGEDVKAYKSFTVSDGKDGGDVFKVTKDNANFMNSLVVKPNVGPYLYYSGQTNEHGVVTNYIGYAETNSHVKVNGNMHITDSVAVSSNLTVWGKILLSSWENLRLAWPGYKEDINNGIDCGYQMTLTEYVEQLAAPIIAATNEYAKGDSYVMVTNRYQYTEKNAGDATLPRDYVMNPQPNSGTNDSLYGWQLITKNKRNYIVAMGAYYGIEFFLDLGVDNKESFYHNKFVFDSTLVTATNYVNLGFYNFKGMGNEDYSNGIFETIYSNIEPIERTEAVLRTETREYENWIWDEETGDYILDPDEPYITETYEWWDEYTFDMVWEIEPGTIWEYDITRVGETALRVNVQRIYKTKPYVGTGN